MAIVIHYALLKGRTAMRDEVVRRRSSPLSLSLCFHGCTLSSDDRDAILDSDNGLAAIIDSSKIHLVDCEVLEEAAMNVGLVSHMHHF